MVTQAVSAHCAHVPRLAAAASRVRSVCTERPSGKLHALRSAGRSDLRTHKVLGAGSQRIDA
jgi:hypothetical protein